MRRSSPVALAFAGVTLIAAWYAGTLVVSKGPIVVGGAAGLLLLLAACFFLYDRLALPLIIAVFFWPGLTIPYVSAELAQISRWLVLAAVAGAGLLRWQLLRLHLTFGVFDLVALWMVATLLASTLVSVNPSMTLAKAASVALVFLFASVGSRVAVEGREYRFAELLLRFAEVLVYGSAVAYGLSFAIFGNANSLGAVTGVLAWPILLWAVFRPGSRRENPRLFLSLAACGALLVYSGARAGMLAALLASAVLVLASRRMSVGRVAAGVVATATLILMVPGVVDPLLHKEYLGMAGRQPVFESRLGPWHDAAAEIRRAPWLGSGFGVTRGASERWRGGFSTQERALERGSSYLFLLEGLGIVGFAPVAVLIVLMLRKVIQVTVLARRYGTENDVAVPLVAIVAAGLVHAGLEDWLLAVGYYLSAIFWVFAFFVMHREPARLPRRSRRTVPGESPVLARRPVSFA